MAFDQVLANGIKTKVINIYQGSKFGPCKKGILQQIQPHEWKHIGPDAIQYSSKPLLNGAHCNTSTFKKGAVVKSTFLA